MTLSNGDQRGPPAPPEGVDAICDVFEAAWLAGQEPRIEDFLPGGEPVHQDVLLRELLLAEWDLRRRHEQHVELQTYLQRFAESGQFVAELWHVWQAKQSECSLDSRANGLATALHSPPAEGLGTVIDRYKLLEKLGDGGFGTVWAAEQREPVKRRVALKVIKLGMDTRQVIARFEAERQALALMDHPNIAKVLDAGATETGGPYFVMELVRGIPITNYCDQERLTTHDRLDLFMKVCHAIQHAHQKGIIHRDIKPSNILVTLHDGVPVPKVIDFGIAKAIQQELTEKTIYTQLAQFIGTPAYMSPEQAEMSGLDIDTRSDIYSLGVLLYELLTGVTPFDAKELMSSSLDAMRKIIREREPLRPSSRLTKELETAKSNDSNHSALPSIVSVPHSAIDRDLDWIVMKCLEKDRTRRYETASSLAMDVKRHLNNEPVIARPPSKAYLLQKLVRRNRGPVLSAVLLLVVLVCGIIGTIWGMIGAEQARRDAVSAEHAEAQRAEGERRAKEQAQKRLAQTEKATEILAAVFREFDPEAAVKEGYTWHALLARRMSEAAEQLEGEAVGDPLAVARLQHVLGISLRKLGHLEQAKRVLVKACQTQERLLGADNLETAATKYQLAMLYKAQAKYDLAEILHQEVLATRAAKLGPDHRDSLTSRHQLAMLYRSQGKYTLAESLHKEVLAIRTAKLGADDSDTIDSQITLATLYLYQRKFALAESLYQEVLAVLTPSLGADHLDTVATKEALAGLYHQQGKFALAEPLYKEAVAVRTAKLGANHPITLESRHHLATLYQWQGKYALAEALSKEVLADRIATLGADHPHTLSSQHDLAKLYLWQANYSLAEEMFQEVLAVRTANLGADHLDTAATKYDLAELYLWQRENYDLAEAMCKEVLAVRIAKLEPDHLLTVDTKYQLAKLYQAQAKYDLAEILHQEVLATRAAKLGPDHRDSLTSRHQLAMLYRSQGKYTLAESLHKEVLAIRTAKLGVDDSDTIDSRDSLTLLYWSMKKLDQSISLVEETIKLRTAQVGPDHPEVLRRQVALGANYCDVGRFADGIALIEEVHRKGRQDPKPAWVRDFLLMAYVQAGKTTEAVALVAERVQEARQHLAADSPELAAALADNGKVLLDAKMYADAEPLLLNGYEGLRQAEAETLPQVKNVRLQDALERLIQLYDASGKPDEAAKWRNKLESAGDADRP